MEHILFEVQLCIEISIFKEKHVFDILIILPSVGGLFIDAHSNWRSATFYISELIHGLATFCTQKHTQRDTHFLAFKQET